MHQSLKAELSDIFTKACRLHEFSKMGYLICKIIKMVILSGTSLGRWTCAYALLMWFLWVEITSLPFLLLQISGDTYQVCYDILLLYYDIMLFTVKK